MLTAGQWLSRRVNIICEDLDSLTSIFHYFSRFSMMCKCSWRLSEAIVESSWVANNAVSSANVPNVVFLDVVRKMCIAHREEDQECSLGVHRNGCGSGLKFLHWISVRTGIHLGTISAGWNSLRARFFSFWIVAMAAILYQMPGLRLKMRLYNTVGFPWLFWWRILCGGIVALWSGPVVIQIDGLGYSLAGSNLYWFFWYKNF